MSASEIDREREAAARQALGEVRPGMKLGLGTGRAARHFVRLLGAEARAGLRVTAVATSEETASLARAEGIALAPLDGATLELDLAVDGADEIDPGLRLIKGGGGALLREKIVATAARAMIVIAERSKLVAALGAAPLPIEVVPFGLAATRRAIELAASRLGLAGALSLRGGEPAPFVTDGGHHIVDASFGAIADPERLAAALDTITGVVEHGLFLGLAKVAFVAGDRRTPA